MGDVDSHKRLLRRVEFAKQLVVAPAPDSAGDVVVDAHWLTRDVNDVRYWRLSPDAEIAGVWHHYPSGEKGSLAHLLFGIASTYEQPRATETTER